MTLVLVTLGLGCAAKPAPTTPPQPPITVYGNLVAYDVGSSSCSSNCNAGVSVIVFRSSDGASVTNATVILTTPTGPVTLPYLSGSNYGVTSCRYQAGYVYNFDVKSPTGNANASVTAPGSISFSSNGASPYATWTATWVYDSVDTYIDVTPNGLLSTLTTSQTGHLASPYTIPGSAFPSHGTYTLDFTCYQDNQFNSGSYIAAKAELSNSIAE